MFYSHDNYKESKVYRIPDFLELDNIFSRRKTRYRNFIIKALDDIEGNICTYNDVFVFSFGVGFLVLSPKCSFSGKSNSIIDTA